MPCHTESFGVPLNDELKCYGSLGCYPVLTNTKLPMAAVSRTRTLGETDGFMNVLVDSNKTRVLGFAALRHGAGELLPKV